MATVYHREIPPLRNLRKPIVKQKAIFVTGATGFVGSNLAVGLQLKNPYTPIFLLARDKNGLRAEVRIKKLIPDFNGRVIEGDICEEGLGISNDDLTMLSHYDLECWHIAGNTSFAEEEREEIFQVNLLGTNNVLLFCKVLNIKRLHYMSTAYIAGDRSGLNGYGAVAFEDEMYVGQRLRNAYEESKYLAEMDVREATDEYGLATTIYRISIAVGRYSDGFTTSYTGYYGYMRGFKILRDKILAHIEQYNRYGVEKLSGTLRIPLRVWGSPEATVNIVCINYLCEVILRLASKPQSIGRTFHVVNPTPPRYGWLLETGLKILKIEGVKVIDPEDSDFCPENSNEVERKINKAVSYYQDYVSGEPVFDNRNVREVLGEIPLHHTVDKRLIGKLLAYAVEHNFGKC